MCINKKCIVNPYTHRSLWVNCGVCPACQQEKANKRKRRIDATGKVGNVWYFITLTYDNKYLPYVKLSDLLEHRLSIPVYRNYDSRISRVGTAKDGTYKMAVKTFANTEPLCYYDVSEDFYLDYPFRGVRSAKFLPGCVGVCYYSDLQDFFKRFRQNLARKYHFTEKLQFYACSEYGSETMRPHFHILVNAPYWSETLLRNAYIDSWQYDRHDDESFQVSSNASGYVASYVNKHSSLPPMLQHRFFKQTHSYSQGFGIDFTPFKLSNILDTTTSDYLEYNIQATVKGIPTKLCLPVPKYVVNRYFPRFTGYCKLSRIALFDLLAGIKKSDVQWVRHCDNIFRQHQIREYVSDLKFSDYVQLKHTFLGAFKRCCSRSDKIVDELDYAFAYVTTWERFDRTIFKHFYAPVDMVDQLEQYDNIADLCYNNVRNFTLELIGEERACYPAVSGSVFHQVRYGLELDPNYFISNLKKHQVYFDLFMKKMNKRRVTNVALSQQGVNV